MKMKLLFAIALTAFFSLMLSSTAHANPMGCSYFDKYGQLIDSFKTTLFYDLSKNLSIVDVEHKRFYRDRLIYDKTTNELVGDQVHHVSAPFPDFSEWKKACSVNALRKCDSVGYAASKTRYESDPKWTKSAHQIAEDDPRYFTVMTDFTVVQKLRAPVEFTSRQDLYDVYETQSDVDVDHEVYVNNAISKNLLFSTAKLKAFVRYSDEAISYSLYIDRRLPDSKFYGTMATNTVCQKP